MRKLLSRVLLVLALAIAGVIVFNLSAFAPVPDGELKILSHRGMHQTFDRTGLTNQTCTATRIFPPTHRFLENTLPGIEAAFQYGADIVEIDAIQTADGAFAVFHDWTLDCRTNGSGRTADHTLEELQALDIGYGYTADKGATYPLRGTGIAMMPDLRQVLDAFPALSFQINIKGNRSADADALWNYLSVDERAQANRLSLFSGPRFAERWRALETGLSVATTADAKTCAKAYLMTGWTGRISKSCEGFGIVAPQNISWLYWGWPRRIVHRFKRRNMRVVLIGPLGSVRGGIDTLEQAEKIPDDYRGWVMTNRIEIIGPALKPNDHQPAP